MVQLKHFLSIETKLNINIDLGLIHDKLSRNFSKETNRTCVDLDFDDQTNLLKRKLTIVLRINLDRKLNLNQKI